MQLPTPFLRLPYSFEAKRLEDEVAELEDDLWMAHPNRMNGNSAVPLVSVNGGDNDEFAGQMKITPHLARCDYIQQVMASFDEVIARSRLMKLAPGCEVSAHVDFNYHWYNRVRIHIPVTTNPDVLFYCGDEVINMQAGECWIFDSWRVHKVVNSSEQERVHLVIDTAGSSKFWRMVNQLSNNKDIKKYEKTISYSESRKSIIRTERYNVAPVMAPGELEAMVNELILDFRANSKNNLEMVEQYSLMLTDLAKDWRALWLEYGMERTALPRYQSLLNDTVKRLAPHPRALVAKSNNVGVNPIIMQRILRAALYVDERDRFIAS